MIDFFRHSLFAESFTNADLVAIDVGARGGFDPDWDDAGLMMVRDMVAVMTNLVFQRSF